MPYIRKVAMKSIEVFARFDMSIDILASESRSNISDWVRIKFWYLNRYSVDSRGFA